MRSASLRVHTLVRPGADISIAACHPAPRPRVSVDRSRCRLVGAPESSAVPRGGTRRGSLCASRWRLGRAAPIRRGVVQGAPWDPGRSETASFSFSSSAANEAAKAPRSHPRMVVAPAGRRNSAGGTTVVGRKSPVGTTVPVGNTGLFWRNRVGSRTALAKSRRSARQCGWQTALVGRGAGWQRGAGWKNAAGWHASDGWQNASGLHSAPVGETVRRVGRN